MLSSGRWSGKADGSSSRCWPSPRPLSAATSSPTPRRARPRVPAPTVASVRIEYRQPNGCANATPLACENLVVFFGSWMRPGQEIYLTADPGSHVWTGVAQGVPVNWPPVEAPHLVRVFDPHLVDTSTGGVTAARLLAGRSDPHPVRLPGNAPGERRRLRRRQRRRPQPALASVTGPVTARGCPGSGPRARAGARLAGRPGRPRTRRASRRRASAATYCSFASRADAAARWMSAIFRRVAVSSGRQMSAWAYARAPRPGCRPGRRESPRSAPARAGSSRRRRTSSWKPPSAAGTRPAARREPDHLLDRDDPRRVRLDRVAEAAKHAIDTRVGCRCPPARRPPAPRRRPARAAPGAGRSRGAPPRGRGAPPWHARRNPSARSSSGLRADAAGAADPTRARASEPGPPRALPTQARPSR